MTRDTRRALMVVDLAFGDCGKGSIVDYLCRREAAHCVVRFNGGPQAGHNVVTPDGRHHTFSQFGSGTFLPGVRTLLSRFMLIDPYALLNEEHHLDEIGVTDPTARLMIDRRCIVITPAHQAANRLRELWRGESAHGTCGTGVGEAMRDAAERPDLVLYAAELGDRAGLKKKLLAVWERKREELRAAIAELKNHSRAQDSINTLIDPAWVEVASDVYVDVARRASLIDEPDVRSLLCSEGAVIFEGAQGVLLDERFGFHPHTTWSTTTFANADALLDEAGYESERPRIGVLRSYFTRHGPGPMVTEDPSLSAALPEPHNDNAGWQGQFRVGVFDAVAARYALAVAGGVHALALTHADRIARLPPRYCNAYGYEDAENDCFVRDGIIVRDIVFDRAADLARMEQLTRSLRRCRAVFSGINTPAEAGLVEAIERTLEVPIEIVSKGPTADQKRARPHTRLS